MNFWPNPVVRLATAISVAEGSNPDWHNPGDLTYAHGHATTGVANKEGVLIFVRPQDGWEALYHEVGLMLSGRSHIYKLTDTLEQVGLKYSGGDTNWSKNVAAYLGVPESTTLQQLSV